MLTLRKWLAAHEAGHITYVEIHSDKIEYSYIDDLVRMDGNTQLFEPLEIENAEVNAPASGAAGEFAYYLNEVGDTMPMGQFIRNLIDRTETDRNLFYMNMDYNGLVNKGIVDPKEVYFVKFAKRMVYDKYIRPELFLFNAIRAHLYRNGFIGRSCIDAIKASRAPNNNDIASDYNRIPESIRIDIRSDGAV
jgi:hypothetical protein